VTYFMEGASVGPSPGPILTRTKLSFNQNDLLPSLKKKNTCSKHQVMRRNLCRLSRWTWPYPRKYMTSSKLHFRRQFLFGYSY